MSCFLQSCCKFCATGGEWTDPSGGYSQAIKSTTISAGPPSRRRAKRHVGVAVFPNRLHLIPWDTTQSPKLTNYSPKGTAVVSTSIANNESYGCVGSGVGRISYASCEFTGKHYGYHDRDHYDHDRLLPRRPIRRNNHCSNRPPIDVHC